MILVTGAAGKTGQAVIRALARRGAAVRALVRRPAQGETVRRLGAQDVAVGDMRYRADVAAAVQDVQAIYHICPNMAPDEVAIAESVMDAARRADVTRFVYHSVLHPQVEAMPHHWRKMRVEESLFTAGLPYTILQPAAYMQNVLAGWETIVRRGVYCIPYSAETRLGMVDLADVAEVAARVLTEPGHEGAIYELAGPEVLTQAEVAACLQRVLGRPVRAETTSRDEWASQARAAGLSAYAIDTLLQMFHYYEQFGFWGNPRVLTWLLERPPTSFETFARRVAGA